MNEVNYKQRLAALRTIVFDVDGVFTDNHVLLMPGIDPVRTFHTRDAYAVQLALKEGLRIVVISGGRSQGVADCFIRMGVKDLYLGVADKRILLQQLIDNGLDTSTTAYMGDDVPDIRVMQQVAFPCCPHDAVPEVKAISVYVSGKPGGQGCVRDLLEQVLKVQGGWMQEQAFVW